ncbi:plasmid replication protein RepC [Paracoccus aerius]|uniref:Replication initiation protein n=1 Tax=Paracoccus aerius TaxID=1915382 RepID=A0ABS1S8U0_9RHOB|nr:plasmid replication protein RepC [Paracoccus aerius]MBL3675156.1 replication initiation protein [Paracoccus aerius]
MRHISTTSQGRRPEAHRLSADETPLSASWQQSVDKWSLIQDLTDGREALGLTDRNLAVLSALLSFYPGRELRAGALMVFPSNASLSARLHGMPESTLRRHLAALCQAGLINRCDSPNGKRYATRDGQGRIDRVFGFDLRPLLDRAAEIAEAAEDAREARRLVRKTRQSISLLLRDLALSPAEPGMQSGACLAELQRMMRRKLDLAALGQIESRLLCLLADLGSLVEAPEMSGNDSQNERHQQNTDSDDLESVKADEPNELPPLELVLKAAPEIATYAQAPVRNWHDLARVADFVRPMLGITRETWSFARQSLGEGQAAVALSCILQRFSDIRNPGAYLRRLAQAETFRIGPMIKALLRRQEAPGL